MGMIYGSLNVDERYSSILEPNLYYDSVFVPGVTFTDDYEEGPAGAIYVHKLATSAATPGVPGRDFTDEATQDELIPILLNNNFQKSKKIYGVQAAAVSISLANEQLTNATNEIKEGWGQSAFACLVNEGTVADDTTEIADGGAVAAFLAARTTASESKIKPDTLLCSARRNTFHSSLTKLAISLHPLRTIKSPRLALSALITAIMSLRATACQR